MTCRLSDILAYLWLVVFSSNTLRPFIKLSTTHHIFKFGQNPAVVSAFLAVVSSFDMKKNTRIPSNYAYFYIN
jgi:hypothetical protein